MDGILLTDIPLEIDVGSLLKRLRLPDGSPHSEDVLKLVRQAQSVGRPKCMYKAVFIESRSEDSVVIDGVTFTSRVLRVNLDQVYRVFPFITTCGRELDAWADGIDDSVHRFWADTIKEMGLRSALAAFHKHLDEHYVPGRTSTMNPGSLSDWPMEEQVNLFDLMGDTRELVGVELTDSYLMEPTKSVSGICFPAETRFESCQLCPREKCPGRRALYDKELYDRKYR